MSEPAKRGKLKVFLGFAAGVGKTYQMLEEAQELKRAGVDVVIGYVECHGRQDTVAKTAGLEILPRTTIRYRDRQFEEMDTGAILARHPQVCLVDEFPHTNIPGSEHAKRWEDVLRILDASIDVQTTMNIQHLESLNDKVWQISGVRVRETIPDWLLEQADEVVMVDLTPRALLNRLERGVVYGPEKAAQALDQFFRESTLVALREMALRQTAHEVNVRHGEESGWTQKENGSRPQQREKILVLVNADPSTVALIRRAKRVADFIGADCIAIAIRKPARGNDHNQARKIEEHLNFARNLHVDARLIDGTPLPDTLVRFARTNGVTQIFLAWAARVPWIPAFFRNDVQRIVQLAHDMQVTIVDQRRQPGI